MVPTTAALDLSIWRNDDAYEYPLRVIGPDLTGVSLRAQIRQERDTPGAALVALETVTNGNAEGVRLASVTMVDGRYENDIRIRINKSTRQALPYTGVLGDAWVGRWVLAIGGKTRVAGNVRVLAHALDSDAAPTDRPENYDSYFSAGESAAPAAGATLTIAQDGGATLVIDGADQLSSLVKVATDAIAQIEDFTKGETGAPGRDASQMAERAEYNADLGNLKAGDTAFNIPFEYQPGKLVVIFNGLALENSDFSAPGGSTVTLTRPVSATDRLILLPFLPPNQNFVRLNLLMFGAAGDGIVNDTPAINRALSYAAALGATEIEVPPPAVAYRMLSTAIYRGTDPVKLIGTVPTAGRALFTRDQAAFRFDGPRGGTAFVFETSGTSVAEAMNGLELENLLIYRLVAELTGDGGIGLAVRGVYGGVVRNVTISGFDTGLLTDDNPSSAGSNSVRTGKISFYDVRILQPGTYRMRLRGTAQCIGINLSLLEESVQSYFADLAIENGTNGGRSDGNTFYGGAFIGSDDPAKQPNHNVLCIDTIFNAFFGVAFERARVAGCSVVANNYVYTESEYAAAFNSCWWDGQQGFGGDFNRTRVFVNDPRHGGHFGQVAAFRFVGDPFGQTQPQIGGGVRGGIIGFNGPAGIEIISAAGVEVNGTEGRDMKGQGRPLVRVDVTAVDTQLIGLRPAINTVAVVDAGANTLLLGRDIKAQRWILDPTFYAQIQGGSPVIAFAAGSFMGFNRVSKQFEIFVEGTLAATIGKTGITASVKAPA